MKQNNLLLNISDQQLRQAGLTRAQARKSLAALDYRDNDVFRHVMNAENPVSPKDSDDVSLGFASSADCVDRIGSDRTGEGKLPGERGPLRRHGEDPG